MMMMILGVQVKAMHAGQHTALRSREPRRLVMQKDCCCCFDSIRTRAH